MATSASTGSSNLTSSSNWNIIEAVNTSGTSNVTTVYFNGISNASNTASLSSVPATFSNTLYVNGRAGTSTNSVAGNFGELLVFSNALTDAQRQQVEGYLASKWGSNVSSGPSITPTSISGCQIWLDASDTSTYVLSGSNLTQLKDKSGNAYHFSQSSGYSNATVQTNYANGLNAWNFTGSNVYRSPNGSACYPLDCYIVIASKALARTDFIAVGDTSTDNFNSLTFGEYTASRWHNGSSGFSRTPNTVSPTNETSTGLLLMNWSLSNSNYIIRRNGSLLTQTSSYTYSFSTSSSSVFQLGYREPWSSYPNPDIACAAYFAEVVVYNSQLSTTSRQQIEGYLAWKWGLQSNLPSGHPYASTLDPTHPFCSVRPFTRAFQPIDIPGCQLWLDAADLKTIAGTTTVTGVTDKAQGIALTTQGTSSLLSLVSNNINGNPALYFNNSAGNNVYLSGTLSNILSGTAFIVWQAAAQSSVTYRPIFTWSPVGQQAAFGYVSSGTLVGPYVTFVGAATPTTSVTTGSNYITDYTWTGTTTGVSFNGAIQTVGTQAAVSGATTLFKIGWDNGLATTMYLGELLLYNSVLTTSQRQQVEGYLAAKWGLSSSLPSAVSSPLSISGCQLWLDGQDASSFTFSTGSNISVWKDKSVLSSDATASGTPVLTANSINGYTSVATPTGPYFTGSMSITSNTLTCFVVATTTASLPLSGNDQRLVSLENTTNVDYGRTDGVIALFNQNTTSTIATYRASGPLANNAISTNVPFLAVSEYDGTNAYLWQNGTAGTLASSASTGNFTITKYGIGNQANPTTEYWRGYIGEVIIYNVALTTSQRQQVETYLGNKWGISGTNAGATHPFKFFPPLTVSFTPLQIPGCRLWFDAADTSTIATTSSNITTWTNKGISGVNAVSNSSYTTAKSGITTLNGLNVVSWPTLSQMMMSNLTLPSPQKSVFYIFRSSNSLKNTSYADKYIMPMNCLSTTGFQTYLYSSSGSSYTNYNACALTGITDNVNFSNTTTILNTPILIGAVNASTSASNVATVNGSTQTLSASGTNAFLATSATYTLNNSIYTSGWDLAEFILYDSQLTSMQRQQVEGYLAAKWGVKSSLPATHPYNVITP